MGINLFDILMLIFTVFIFFGIIRSAKAKNRFAVGFGVVSLAVFLLSDFLIFYL